MGFFGIVLSRRGYGRGVYFCEVGVFRVEDCGLELSIEGDLRREEVGEYGVLR